MKRHQQTRRALGSEVLLTVVLADGVQSAPIFNALWQQIDGFEQRFSRFLPTSELSQFNASAGKQRPISREFHTLLSVAKDFAQQTGGLYNPCILPALQRAGYKGSWPNPEADIKELDYAQRAIASWREITVSSAPDNVWARIPATTALDFGGIGKGYLLDQLGEALAAKGISNYWLSLGGDILCNGHEANGDSWYIGIAHATDVKRTAAAVKNHGRTLAVATSGTTKRQGISKTGKWHHIIDPRTGKPAITNVLTATVCMPNAVTADIAAKCLIIDPNTPILGTANYLLQIADGSAVAVQRIGDIWE